MTFPVQKCLRLEICVKYFLSFPQINLSSEETEFLNDKIYSYKPMRKYFMHIPGLSSSEKSRFIDLIFFQNWQDLSFFFIQTKKRFQLDVEDKF